MISSTSNAQIKYIMQLQKKSKLRNEDGVFIIEGPKMFFELPKEQLLKVYVSCGFLEDKVNEKKLKDMQIKYEIVRDDIFVLMCDTKTPQGILALAKQFKYTLEDILDYNAGIDRFTKYREKKHNLLILETIQDPGNLGTMLRAGEAAGVTGVIMNRKTVDIYNQKVIRSTMGSLYRVPFVYVDDLKIAIKSIRDNNIKIYAAHLKAEKNYDRADYVGDVSFLIGNEANGLSSQIADLADEYIKIPMEGKIESLNAAIASAVILFEVSKQRRNS